MPNPPSLSPTAYRCKFMYSSRFFLHTFLNFCLDLSFLLSLTLPPPWSDIDSVHILFFPPTQYPPLCHFGLTPSFSPFPSISSSSIWFIWTCTNIDFWVVGCSLGPALSTAPVYEGTLASEHTYNTQVLMVVLWWTCWYPCQMKGFLRHVCNVKGGA